MDEGYVVELNVYERMLIGGIVPAKDTYEKAVLGKNVKKTVELTEEEIGYYEVVSHVDGQKGYTTWNAKGNTEYKPYTITKMEMRLLKELVETIKKEGEVETTESFIDFCDKISDAKQDGEKGKEEVVEEKKE